ncbi:MAG TPA: hypothetical protein VNT56_05105 [Acidimicrobiales bacterium]|nr:hypothetical protein [Acidimicrobiales bacterium]
MADALSAQVVLRPADASVDPDGPITGATLARHLPDRARAEETRSWFDQAGFEVGPLIGIGFAITAPAEVFAHTFGPAAAGAAWAAITGESGDTEIAKSAVPDDVRPSIRAVTFTPPADFGPGAP